MNTTEIKNTLAKNKKTRECFYRVCAADELMNLNMKEIPKPSVIIANTDDSKKPGMHWVSFFLPKKPNQVVEYFDSFGQPLNVYNNFFEKFLSQYYTKCRCNVTQIQGNLSTVCGQYCCIYALYKCGRFSLNKFLKLFSMTDFDQNDKNVVKLFNKYFKSKRLNSQNKNNKQNLCFPIQKCFPRVDEKKYIKTMLEKTKRPFK